MLTVRDAELHADPAEGAVQVLRELLRVLRVEELGIRIVEGAHEALDGAVDEVLIGELFGVDMVVLKRLPGLPKDPEIGIGVPFVHIAYPLDDDIPGLGKAVLEAAEKATSEDGSGYKYDCGEDGDFTLHRSLYCSSLNGTLPRQS